MPYREILYAVDDAVAVITMNRPERLNAFTVRMLAEVRHAVAAAEDDARVVGIILTGAGRGFCAGMDLAALDDISAGGRFDPTAAGEIAATPGDPSMGADFAATFSYFLAVRKPVIAAINGPCAGLGLCFALLCDLRFAERGARFNTAFAARGLVAEHGMSWLLPRLVGTGRALDLLWTARKFAAEEAERWGLVERLCDDGSALAAARDYVAELARTVSPTSLMVMKQQVYRHLMQTLGPAMQDTERLMQESLGRPDFREGVRSFLEQRPPQFARLGSA